MDARLMIPGPVEVDDEVLAAMGGQVRAHYGLEWVAAYTETIDLLKQVFQTKNDVYLLVGSGSSAIDMGIGSLLGRGEKLVVAANGYFGHRLAEIARAYAAEPLVASVPYGQVVDPDEVEKLLEETPGAQAVAVVHHETSTGIVNPVKDLATIAHRFDIPLIVDAISSFGGIDLPIDAWGVDVCAAATQKALETPPGLAPIAISRRAWKMADSKPDLGHGWYLNMRTWREYVAKWEGWHPHPITQATNIVMALRASLRAIVAEGLPARLARFRRIAAGFRRELEARGFRMVAPQEYASPLVVAAYPPAGVDAPRLIQTLREKHGIMISGGIAEWEGKIIRVGLMGRGASDEYIQMFLRAVDDVVSRIAETRKGAGYAEENS